MQKTARSLTYSNTGVSYEDMDPVKINAQKAAKSTASNISDLGEKELPKSRGESAFVYDCIDHFRALVIEGLGTKNLVADEMAKITGKSYYQQIAQDTVAAIVNDLVTVGARPEIVNAYFAVGDSAWFKDKRRVDDLIIGWKKACDLSGATWGGGETPTLSGIVNPKTIELGGAATGIIKPKSRLVLGDKLQAGDTIVLFTSSGIHANGLTLTRKIAKNLKKGFGTEMPSGKLFGEAILSPSIIYAKVIEDIAKSKVDIHYMVNITGHGWRKIMRYTKRLRYVIEKIPSPQEEFLFMQKHGPITDEEAYATFNMGAGFAIFIKNSDFAKVEQVSKIHKIKVFNAGYVEEGQKEVVIKPINITYTAETLDLR